MRNGDLYKMQRLLATGTSLENVIKRFRHYPEEEILRFLAPAPTKKTRAKTTAEPT